VSESGSRCSTLTRSPGFSDKTPLGGQYRGVDSIHLSRIAYGALEGSPLLRVARDAFDPDDPRTLVSALARAAPNPRVFYSFTDVDVGDPRVARCVQAVSHSQGTSEMRAFVSCGVSSREWLSADHTLVLDVSDLFEVEMDVLQFNMALYALQPMPRVSELVLHARALDCLTHHKLDEVSLFFGEADGTIYAAGSSCGKPVLGHTPPTPSDAALKIAARASTFWRVRSV